MNPYRSIVMINKDKNIWQNIFAFSKEYACPACNCNNRDYVYTDDNNKKRNGVNIDTFTGCIGKKSFWFKKYLCPNKPHLHIKCWACKLNFIMWSE